jgi:formylglycine-generating enzyme required for sulfatase activity
MKKICLLFFASLFFSFHTYGQTKKPQLYVLAVGIEEYADRSVPQLSYCAEDARDVAAALGRQTALYEVMVVKVLTDRQATRAAIRSELDNFAKCVTDNDLFVFFFSGHGIQNGLMPYDYNFDDDQATVLGKDDLSKKLNDLECSKLVLLDACYSGSFAKGARAVPDFEKAFRDMIEGFEGGQLSLVLCSATSDQVSWECEPCGHGYFTQGLLDCFSGLSIYDPFRNENISPDTDRDGLITLTAFENYVKRWVTIRTANQTTKQKVYSSRNGGLDVPIFRPENASSSPPFVPLPKDSDSDGIPDNLDKCPDQKGIPAKEGCPAALPPPSLSDYEETVSGVSFKMIKVAGGTFMMGCTVEQGWECGYKERPAHEVTLSGYSIGETEVTVGLWRAVMGSIPDGMKCTDAGCPVANVSWYDAQEFIQKLNRLTGKLYRLPTESEWEYAARGGRESRAYKYSGSDAVNDVAWYGDNSGESTHEVKGKNANELGIYDMSGNVWEWCSDWYDDYLSASQTNPTGPKDGIRRVYRGGSWPSEPRSCRVSYRFLYTPETRYSGLGFRLSSQ